jgi:ribonuclease HI
VQNVHCYVDGGCIGGSPGKAIYWSVGLELDRRTGETAILYRRRLQEARTNNEAEWFAVLEILRELVAYYSGLPATKLYPYLGKPKRGARVIIYSDSQLVERQFTSEWRTRSARLRPLAYEARELVRKLERLDVAVKIQWVPRSENVKRLGH